MTISILLFGAALLIILFGASLFTNGVEWLGKRLGVSEGAVGSIFAGVGTALPETVIPLVAIFTGTGQDRVDVGIGAIIGAPFMLSTLTLPLLGLGVLTFAAMGRRDPVLSLDYRLVRTDLEFFLGGYMISILLGHFVFPRWGHIAYAAGLFVLYAAYLWITLRREGESGEDLGPLIFARRSADPPLLVIGLQIAVSLGIIIGGAELFVYTVKEIATAVGVSPLILSLMITPVATELPEKLNSLIWIYQKKDTLAVANITGAMVFQGTFPVAIGILGTPWRLDPHALVSAYLAIGAGLFFYLLIRVRGGWSPLWLILAGLLYAAFGAHLAIG